MKCPKCKKGKIRQQLNVFVECDVECRNLSKKGIRSKSVEILGAGWDRAIWFCDRGCGYFLRLAKERG